MIKMDVFISYKSEDYGKADWVRSVLQANGISCWMAPESISGSRSYALEIPKAIGECQGFVLILSRQAQKSKWVPKEVDRAINEEKSIIPFAIDDSPLTNGFEFYLSNVQIIPAYKDLYKAAENLVRVIRPELETVVFPDRERQEAEKQEAREAGCDQTDSGPVLKEAEAKRPDEKAEKRKAEKPKKKSGKKRPGKKGLSRLWILLAVLVLMAVVVLLAVSGRGNRSPGSVDTVSVAGRSIESNSTSVTIKDAVLTEEDMEALSQLHNIQSLSIQDCTIESEWLNSLCHSTQLTLEISGCGLTNEALKAIDFSDMELTKLVLNDNPDLSDLTPIKPLADTLNSLCFDHCKVSDITVLKSFQRLNHLTAIHNAIADISVLSENKIWANIKLSENELTSLEALHGSKHLKIIEVGSNRLESLAGLEESIELETVIAGENAIADLSGLKNTTILQKVDLSCNKISDISLLAKSSETLKELDISENELDDITALKDCRSLTTLAVGGNRITNLNALESCEKLTSLSAYGNRIDNIDGLSALYDLEYLDLSGNEIRSTDAICFDYRESGVTVDLSNNRLTTLNLPVGLYRELYLNANAIEQVDYLEFKYLGKVVLDYHEKLDFNSVAAWECHYYYILDCPLDKQLAIRDTLKSKNSFTSVEFLTTQEYEQQKP